MISIKAVISMVVVAGTIAVAGPATAATYVHDTTSTGNVLASGQGVSGLIKSGTNAVITTSIGTITCDYSDFNGKVGTSGGSTVTGTLDTLVLGWTPDHPCTSTGFPQAIDECLLMVSVPLGMTASGSTGGTVTWGSSTTPVTLDCWSGSSLVCTFTTTGATGTYTNSTNQLTFTNVALSTSFPCSPGKLSVTYSPVTVDATGGNVVLNTTA